MTSFSITYDYRCPFARIANLHVIEGLEAGAGWQVEFSPFSLSQAHVPEDGVAVWDEPAKDSGLLALQASVVVRDLFEDSFLAVHRGLFELRHTESRDLRDPAEISGVLEGAGVDAAAVLAEIAAGWPLAAVRAAHEKAVAEAGVWGVPTFVIGASGVFVRLMEPPAGDSALAISTVERIIGMIQGWPELNEFKHTTVKR